MAERSLFSWFGRLIRWGSSSRPLEITGARRKVKGHLQPSESSFKIQCASSDAFSKDSFGDYLTILRGSFGVFFFNIRGSVGFFGM